MLLLPARTSPVYEYPAPSPKPTSIFYAGPATRGEICDNILWLNTENCAPLTLADIAYPSEASIVTGLATILKDHVSLTVNREASDLARLSSAASFGSVTVSRGRPCSSRSRHSARRALNSLAFCSAPFVG